MLQHSHDYADAVRSFRWSIPKYYNIGVDACDKWADGSGRLALIEDSLDGTVKRYTFDQLRSWSNRLAEALQADGVTRGGRVGVLLPQSLETAVSHLAIYKLGAVAVPLFALFGTDAIQYRLINSGARALITDAGGLAKLMVIRGSIPGLAHVYLTGGARPEDVQDFWETIEAQDGAFTPADTLASDPAIIIYTSGTTGKPKGALHAQRLLLGHLPGVEISHNFFPEQAKLMWTPADWAWIGGLYDVLFPSLHHGIPVLACRLPKFDAETALELMAKHGVTHAFLPPTALKLMRAAGDPARCGPYQLVSIASGGETLGRELLAWGRKYFGITVNEFYGQTECNMVVSSCAALFEPHIGAIGRPVPGHAVEIIDESAKVMPTGVEGDIAVRAPDPVMLLEYWQDPAATSAKFRGGFLVTGDRGWRDADGFIWFVGRDDDVITTAGYRVGPGPIEDCLLQHPAVRIAAVIGVPDIKRTEAIKACVVLKDGYSGSAKLVTELQERVRREIGAHEYPRIVEFVSSLPMTTTGKVIRRRLREEHIARASAD